MTKKMKMGKLNSPIYKYLLWVFLSLPAIGIIDELITSTQSKKAIEHAIHGTGEFGARWMLIALMITPLNIWLKGWRGPRFLMKHRRNIGVAAFMYAFAHMIFYIIGVGGLEKILNEIKFYIIV